MKTESIHNRTIPEEIVSAILIQFAFIFLAQQVQTLMSKSSAMQAVIRPQQKHDSEEDLQAHYPQTQSIHLGAEDTFSPMSQTARTAEAQAEFPSPPATNQPG